MIAALFQHKRGRDDDGGIQRDRVPLFRQQAGEHVSPQRITHRSGGGRAVGLRQPAQEPCAILRFAGVIDAFLAIGFAATASEMHYYTQPAARFRRLNQAVSIGAVQAALQTMKDHQPGFVLCLRGIFTPCQIHKVIIRQVESLPDGGKKHFTADETRQHGLQMAVRQAPHGDKGRALVGRKIKFRWDCLRHNGVMLILLNRSLYLPNRLLFIKSHAIARSHLFTAPLFGP